MTAQANNTIRTPRNVVAPGLRGRTLRIFIGVLQIWFVSYMLPNFNHFVYSQPKPDIVWLIYFMGIAFAFRWLPDVVNLGFSVRWGKQLRLAYVFFFLGAVVLDLFLFGNIWGPALGILLYILGLYLHTHLGIAHILSGILGTPGCEMRSYAHLATIILGKDLTEAAICPGTWTAFDRWEASLNSDN